MALIVDSVRFTYEAGTAVAAPVLDGVSLTVESGEVVVCVGATGSGKSTLLRLCAGLLIPTEGSVVVDGASARARHAVGIVFQNPEAQFFAETVGADVAFGPKNLGLTDVDGAVTEALSAVGLDASAFRGRSPFTLSGGEARRVAIAGVLAMQTPYLLLDEPTVGLDPFGRRAVLQVVRNARDHAGVLVVTHDADEFLSIADRVVALHDGRVLFEGTPQVLAEEPELWERAGLALPPLVMAQHLARGRGATIPSIVLDVEGAARALVAAKAGVS
ncbi:MAG: ATP-binding cassette domain-containing protein [Coriobacteriia bacterium]|nr:ATP-binding cassette domain-containing protein [Coriobacteriia bacterium]